MELVQTKNSLSSNSVRFYSGVLNLNSKVKSELLWLKNYQESWSLTKFTKLMTQISKFRPIYERGNKISILISILWRGFIKPIVSKSTEPNDLSSFFPLILSFHCCTLPLLCIRENMRVQFKLFPTSMTDTALRRISQLPSAKISSRYK